MPTGMLQSDLLICDHLGSSDADESDLMHFMVRDNKGAGLCKYIQHFAFPDEDAGTMRTYLVRDAETLELVGYFSLKAGLISYNEHVITVTDPETGLSETRPVFDTIPGVELANFAVNQAYVHAHPDMKGVGMLIYELFILPIIAEASKLIGIKILYIFALPYDDLIARYEQYGFSRLEKGIEEALHKRLKPRYDQACTFMYRML